MSCSDEDESCGVRCVRKTSLQGGPNFGRSVSGSEGEVGFVLRARLPAKRKLDDGLPHFWASVPNVATG